MKHLQAMLKLNSEFFNKLSTIKNNNLPDSRTDSIQDRNTQHVFYLFLHLLA